MNKTRTNVKKPHFAPNLDPFAPNLDLKIFFVGFNSTSSSTLSLTKILCNVNEIY